MDSREAMLREFNLYPMWVRRELPEASAVTETQALAEIVPEVRPEVVPEALPEVMPEVVPEVVLEVVSEVLLEIAPQVPPEVLPDEVAESLPVSEPVDAAQPELAPALPLVEAIAAEVIQTEESSLEEDNLLNIQYGIDHLSASYHQASEDSLREFQLKVAGGPLADIDWPELKQKVRDCDLCKLRADCTQTVSGSGDENADWMFVGEASGEAEEASGLPLVGPAGRLLENMLLAIKLKREQVYITNVIKCRPPEDRHPHVGEIAACLPYLKRQIALVQPKLIVALGKTAASALLETDATITSLRGTLHDYKDIPLIVTFHPAYLLRSPHEKARAWEDLCLAVATMSKTK